MVLKVVTGTILETLELSWAMVGCYSILEQQRRTVFALSMICGAGPFVGSIVKERDYLVDNLCIAMLSLMNDEGQ